MKKVIFKTSRNVNKTMQYVKKSSEMKFPKFLESLWKPLTALLPCLIVLECTTYRLKTRMKTHGTSKFVFSYLHSQHIRQYSILYHYIPFCLGCKEIWNFRVKTNMFLIFSIELQLIWIDTMNIVLSHNTKLSKFIKSN